MAKNENEALIEKVSVLQTNLKTARVDRESLQTIIESRAVPSDKKNVRPLDCLSSLNDKYVGNTSTN